MGVSIKDVTKAMSKKFACSVNVAHDDKYGECIQVQGDIHERLGEFFENDFPSLGLKEENIEFEKGGNKKGRKKN